MEIRCIRKEDYDALKEIHNLYYEKEFEFPDFIRHFLGVFVVEDDDTGQIITVGGPRTIVECIAMTDKSISVRQRREALYMLLQASLFATGRGGYREMHAFIQDEQWMKQLLKHKFNRTKGQAIVMPF